MRLLYLLFDWWGGGGGEEVQVFRGQNRESLT
jgi:hypothetical protein